MSTKRHPCVSASTLYLGRLANYRTHDLPSPTKTRYDPVHANAIKSICLLSSPFCSPTSVTSFSSPNSPSIKLSPTSTTTNQQLAGHEGSIIREGKPSPSLSLSIESNNRESTRSKPIYLLRIRGPTPSFLSFLFSDRTRQRDKIRAKGIRRRSIFQFAKLALSLLLASPEIVTVNPRVNALKILVYL